MSRNKADERHLFKEFYRKYLKIASGDVNETFNFDVDPDDLWSRIEGDIDEEFLDQWESIPE